MQQSCQSTQHLLIGWKYFNIGACLIYIVLPGQVGIIMIGQFVYLSSEHTSLGKFSLQLTWRVLCHSPSLVLALRYTHGQMATMVRLREVVDTWNCRRTVWVALTINTNGQYCGSELALIINTPRSILWVRTWPEGGAERYVGPESTLHVGRINVSSHWATITRVTRSLRQVNSNTIQTHRLTTEKPVWT